MDHLRVSQGIKPASLGKVKDLEVRNLIEKCISKASDRLSAKELLMDPFLQSDEDYGSRSYSSQSSSADDANQCEEDSLLEGSRDFMVEGQRKDQNTIFLKLRIADSSGNFRNIHFPFDIEKDTSTAVASEMVEELDLTDHDVSVIAAMIDSEIRSHIPDWLPKELQGNDNFSGDAIPESVNGSGPHDCLSPTTNDSPRSGPLVLERLPSGRKYWSDSPKANGALSPLRPGPSNLTPPESVENLQSPINHKDVNICHDSQISNGARSLEENMMPCGIDSGDIESMVKKIQLVLENQVMELDELKQKHERAVLDLLKELPEEIHQRVLQICEKKISGCKLHDNIGT